MAISEQERERILTEYGVVRYEAQLDFEALGFLLKPVSSNIELAKICGPLYRVDSKPLLMRNGDLPTCYKLNEDGYSRCKNSTEIMTVAVEFNAVYCDSAWCYEHYAEMLDVLYLELQHLVVITGRNVDRLRSELRRRQEAITCIACKLEKSVEELASDSTVIFYVSTMCNRDKEALTAEIQKRITPKKYCSPGILPLLSRLKP